MSHFYVSNDYYNSMSIGLLFEAEGYVLMIFGRLP